MSSPVAGLASVFLTSWGTPPLPPGRDSPRQQGPPRKPRLFFSPLPRRRAVQAAFVVRRASPLWIVLREAKHPKRRCSPHYKRPPRAALPHLLRAARLRRLVEGEDRPQ